MLKASRKVPMDVQVMGRMLASAVRCVLMHSEDAGLAEQTQKLIVDLLVFIPDNWLVTLIKDIQIRGQRHTPGSHHTETGWENLFESLDDYKHRQDALPPKIPSSDPVCVAPECLFFLLYHSVRYAFGNLNVANVAYQWIRDFAPKLHRNDRASLASDIRYYLEQCRSDKHACDEQSWHEMLTFLEQLERQIFAKSRPPKPHLR